MNKKFLLDTNVLSEIRKGKKSDLKVQSWTRSIKLEQQFVSVISLMEIRIGIFSVINKDVTFGTLLDEWYTTKLKPAFSGRVLDISLKEAERFATLSTLRTLPVRDGLIAATACESSMTLVTRNEKDFQGLPISLLNPWRI